MLHIPECEHPGIIIIPSGGLYINALSSLQKSSTNSPEGSLTFPKFFLFSKLFELGIDPENKRFLLNSKGFESTGITSNRLTISCSERSL